MRKTVTNSKGNAAAKPDPKVAEKDELKKQILTELDEHIEAKIADAVDQKIEAKSNEL